MRIDRLLCELNIGSRSQVKEFLKKGQVTVNGVVIKKADEKVDEQTARIGFMGAEYRYRPLVYYMMNKPGGVVSATRDEKERTVLDLFKEQYERENREGLFGIPVNDIFPAGRLDKDTVGLLLLTNDGELSHRLLSPAGHIPKKYLVRTDAVITEEVCSLLEEGVDIGEKKKTLPAKVEKTEDCECFITITEGKFHQIKRMFQAAGLQVVYLKRISMGSLLLDEKLPEGCCRELTQKEIDGLYA